jgi:hypothetical protein
MQVLVTLAHRRGEVVSRDQLIEMCWNGVAVGEDSISRCVYRLRKLGETTGAFSLETITKVGYRLLEAIAPPLPPPEVEIPPPLASGARRKWRLWAIGAGALATAILMVALAAREFAEPPDVDAVVAQLTERLRTNASATELSQVNEAIRALGASPLEEERSAYSALASGDSVYALDVLENLARELEASGDRASAAAVYRKVGGIAVLVDGARAIAAQQRSFKLEPKSLAAFQGLFVLQVLKGAREPIHFADEILKDSGITPQMRGWVLAHRAFAEAEWVGDLERAEASLAELARSDSANSDKAVLAAHTWARATIAFRRNDLAAALNLATDADLLWQAIPEPTSQMSEVVIVRVLQAQGDWSAAFSRGSAVMERRSKAGDLLPGVLVATLCETGLFTGQATKAVAYCDSLVRRGETMPAMLKAYAGMAAAARGDAATTRAEFARADAFAPATGPARIIIQTFEAWASLEIDDDAHARTLAMAALASADLKLTVGKDPKAAAFLLRLLGQILMGAGEPARSCAPLLEAARIYDEMGAAAGREATREMRRAAKCAG